MLSLSLSLEAEWCDLRILTMQGDRICDILQGCDRVLAFVRVSARVQACREIDSVRVPWNPRGGSRTTGPLCVGCGKGQECCDTSGRGRMRIPDVGSFSFHDGQSYHCARCLFHPTSLDTALAGRARVFALY